MQKTQESKTQLFKEGRKLIEEGGLLGGLQMVEKASELGSVKASAFLGFGFYMGRDGLPQDYVLARKYLEVFISQASPGKTWLDIPEESLEKLQYNTKFTGYKALTAEKITRSMSVLSYAESTDYGDNKPDEAMFRCLFDDAYYNEIAAVIAREDAEREARRKAEWEEKRSRGEDDDELPW